MPVTATDTRWSLEVARGRDPGRRYALHRGETTIGSAPDSPSHVGLAEQEGDSPRRMAPKQAAIALAGDRPTIRDLESPGGTFVNRQRLFADQARALAPGDVIQMGAIHLVVRAESSTAKATATPPAPPSPSPSRPSSPAARATPPSAPHAFPDGTLCRTWDGFPTLAAQRWALVRDELASGRIGEYLRRVGRADLLPRREPGWSPDEVLDDWLGRLPTSFPCVPEPEVTTTVLSVPAAAAGGVSRRSLRVSNVGHRLLRAVVTAEPAPGFEGSIRVASGPSGPIIDEAEYVVEIAPPEGAVGVELGAVIVTAAGVSKRVPARVERPPVDPLAIDAGPIEPRWRPAEPIAAGLAGLSARRRLWTFPLAALALRWLVGLGSSLPFGSSPGGLRLAGAAALPALAGLVIGWGAGMRGGFRDGLASAFAGAVVGLFAATVVFAMIQSVEGALGSPALSALALGIGLAIASLVAFPTAGKGRGE